MSTDLAPRTEEALIAASKAEIDTTDMNVPLLKVMQALSSEVSEGDARPGELVHSLTGESYGETVKLVEVDTFKGRFFKDAKSNKTYWSYKNQPVIPDHWPVLGAGEMHFVDHQDAEEQYKARVNAGEIEWGSGPKIATTYNFVGLVIREDGEIESFPVRVSLMKAAAKEARNWQTMLAIARAPWDVVFELSTYKTTSRNNEPFVGVRVKQVGKTTPEQKEAAFAVASQLHNENTNLEFEEASPEPAAPAAAAPGMDL